MFELIFLAWFLIIGPVAGDFALPSLAPVHCRAPRRHLTTGRIYPPPPRPILPPIITTPY